MSQEQNWIFRNNYKCSSRPLFKWGDKEDMQDEGAGSEQGGDKCREDDEGEQEDKESGKEVISTFQGW